MDSDEGRSPDLASRLERAADPDDPSRRSFIRAGAGVVVGAAALAGTNHQLRLLRSKSELPVTGTSDGREQTYADIELRVNGQQRAVRVAHQRTLLLTLREDLGLTGTKKSCNLGQCGACTVLLDGLPVYACMLLALDAQNREITTIEGISQGTELPSGAQRKPVPMRQLPQRGRRRNVVDRLCKCVHSRRVSRRASTGADCRASDRFVRRERPFHTRDKRGRRYGQVTPLDGCGTGCARQGQRHGSLLR
jgi:hypothetical protein